jgi:hypothetical protein
LKGEREAGLRYAPLQKSTIFVSTLALPKVGQGVQALTKEKKPSVFELPLN